MPYFDYTCPTCKSHIESREPVPPKCCGVPMKRVWAALPIVWKCKGRTVSK